MPEKEHPPSTSVVNREFPLSDSDKLEDVVRLVYTHYKL